MNNLTTLSNMHWTNSKAPSQKDPYGFAVKRAVTGNIHGESPLLRPFQVHR